MYVVDQQLIGKGLGQKELGSEWSRGWRGSKLGRHRRRGLGSLRERGNDYSFLPSLTTFLRSLPNCTSFLPNLEISPSPHGSGPVPSLQSRNVLQLRWHGTEATDHVTGSVAQQFSTDLNSTPFSRWPRTCPNLGPGRKEDCNSWDRLGLAVEN